MYKSRAAIVLSAVLTAGMLVVQAQEPTSTPQNQPMQESSAAAPAGHHHRHMHPNRQLKRLTKKLNLTPDQQAQIKPILQDRDQQMESLHADSSMSQQDRRAKMHDIQQDSKTKIEAVLNDQQKQQFEQMMAKRHEHHKAMQGDTTAPPQ